VKKSELKMGGKYIITGNGNGEARSTRHYFPIGASVKLIEMEDASCVFEGIGAEGELITQYVDHIHVRRYLKLDLI
jgi:hypothetical protein